MYADCTWKQNLSGFRLVIGRWKSDRPSSSRSRTLYWQFQVFSLDETIANTYFLSCLVPFYMNCSGDLIHCLKISGNIKNNLRTIWGSNRKKLRTAQPQPKVTGSYKKVCISWSTECSHVSRWISSFKAVFSNFTMTKMSHLQKLSNK